MRHPGQHHLLPLLGVPVRMEGKKRISAENCASPGKLNKVFVRKRGVSKGRSFDVKMGDEKASLISRGADEMPGEGSASPEWQLGHGAMQTAFVTLTQGATLSVPFPPKKTPGIGPAKGNVCMTRMKTGIHWVVFFFSN